MIQRRRSPRYSELTSLLDVLFILLFASLIQAAGVVNAAKSQPDAQTASPAEAAAAPASDASPGAELTAAAIEREELRTRALTDIAESMRQREVLYAHVSAPGILRALERELGGQLQALDIGAPLLHPVADPDVGIEYVSARDPALRLCTRVRVTLGLPDLNDRLVVVAIDAPISELAVALVEGLRADILHCFTDERGVAVLVPPEPTP